MANVGIVRSWTLDEFRRMKGTPKLGSFQAVDKETGEMRNFKSVVFVDNTKINILFVYINIINNAIKLIISDKITANRYGIKFSYIAK